MTDTVRCLFCDEKMTRVGYAKHLLSAKHLPDVKAELMKKKSKWLSRTGCLPYIENTDVDSNKLGFTCFCFGCKKVYSGQKNDGAHKCDHHKEHVQKLQSLLEEERSEEEAEGPQVVPKAIWEELEALKAENAKLKKKNERLEKENDQLGQSLEDDEKYVTIVNRLLNHPLFEGKSVEELEEDLMKVDDGEYILKLERVEEAAPPPVPVAPAPPTERRVGPDFVNRQDGMFISQMKPGDVERIAEPVPEVKVWARTPAPPPTENVIVQSIQPPQPPPLPSAITNAFPGANILGSTRTKLPKKAAASFPAAGGIYSGVGSGR